MSIRSKTCFMLDFLDRPARIRLKRDAAPRRRHTTIELDGRTHGVAVSENRRTRRLTLRLLAQPKDGDAFKITVPPGTPMAEIDAFLARNRSWAAEQIGGRPEPVALADGAVVPVRGTPTRIVHTGPGRGATRLGERAGEAAGEPVLFVAGERAHLARRVTDFLKREAKRDLHAAVARHAAALGVRPRSITVRDTVSRWGSCSTTGALNFSWRIVLAPPEVLDYLAAHEVAHLKEMNHSDRFWALVERLRPGMERERTWLKEHGAGLHLVG